MLTTHDLGDIEDVCQRIVIIDEGRIIFDGSLEAVKDGFARQRELHLQFVAAAGAHSVRLEDRAALSRRRGHRRDDASDPPSSSSGSTGSS